MKQKNSLDVIKRTNTKKNTQTLSKIKIKNVTENKNIINITTSTSIF